MIKIMPTRVIVTDYNGEAQSIEKSLSVWDKNRFRYTFSAYEYDEENKTIIFPGGINKYKLFQKLNSHEIVDLSNKFLIGARRNSYIKMNTKPRDELQEKSIKFLCGNSFSNKSSQKMLSIETGGGKSFCAINFIATKRRIPIIFVDLDTLVQQWKKSIIKFTDTKEEEIYIFSGLESVRKIINMDYEELKKIKFFISLYKTISMTYKNNLLDDLFNKVGFTSKIYDEAHTNYETIFKIDSHTDCESIYLTATPKRSNPIENKVFQNMFYDVKRISSNVVESDNYHNIVLVKIDSNPSSNDIEVCTNKFGFDCNKYSKYVLENKYEFYYDKVITNILFDIILKNGKKKRKTAILFGLKSMMSKFSEDLLNDLNERGLDNYSIGLLSEDTKKSDKDLVLNSDIIITTDKSFGKGIDVSDLECVINFVPTSSDTKTKQMLGRLRKLPNKEVYYFDILDIGFDKIKIQLKNKQKSYKEKAKKIMTLNL